MSGINVNALYIMETGNDLKLKMYKLLLHKNVHIPNIDIGDFGILYILYIYRRNTKLPRNIYNI